MTFYVHFYVPPHIIIASLMGQSWRYKELRARYMIVINILQIKRLSRHINFGSGSLISPCPLVKSWKKKLPLADIVWFDSYSLWSCAQFMSIRSNVLSWKILTNFAYSYKICRDLILPCFSMQVFVACASAQVKSSFEGIVWFACIFWGMVYQKWGSKIAC